MTKCTLMFCVADKHDDNVHVDATGYTWTEIAPEREVIAHAYDDRGQRTYLMASDSEVNL